MYDKGCELTLLLVLSIRYKPLRRDGTAYQTRPPVQSVRLRKLTMRLRKRQQLSTSLTSYRQIEAIYSAIIAVDGVTYCRVYQNAITNPADSRGIPTRNSPVVVGGEPEDIANAMFLRMPVTIQGYGNTLVTLRDKQNQPYNIRFMRPTMVPIFVDITIRCHRRLQSSQATTPN